jgi:RNA polymerase sigma-70 factor (ECF subfamily)
MSQDSASQRLSRISTLWSLIGQAHQGPAEATRRAQEVLLQNYSGAVRRYLLGALKDTDAADELFQEFSLRFLRGDFRRADPERGRFRDFIKTALYHLVVDYQKRRRPVSLSTEPPDSSPLLLNQAEQEFLSGWRQQLMDRAWLRLEEIERTTGQPCHLVLRRRMEQPLLSSAELAAEVGTRLGKAFTVPALRQALYRAREKFVELLLAEVEETLEDPSEENLEQELTDLGLMSYCQSALKRRAGRKG